MSEDGSAKAKKRRKAPLPDFRSIQYKRPVPNKDFIKTNAANAKKSIVMKKEPKRVYVRDRQNDEDFDLQPLEERRPSVRPSYMNRETYGKIPKYLAKRKNDTDGELDNDALEVKSHIPKKSAITPHVGKALEKDQKREKTRKGESGHDRLDRERTVSVAQKMGDEPRLSQRRSSTRIPRKRSVNFQQESAENLRPRRSVREPQYRRGSRIPVSKTDLQEQESLTKQHRKSRKYSVRPESPKYAPPRHSEYQTTQRNQESERHDLRQSGIIPQNNGMMPGLLPMTAPFGPAQSMILPPIPMAMMPSLNPPADGSIEAKLRRLEELERFFQQAHIQHMQAVAQAAQHTSKVAHNKTTKEPFKIVKGDKSGEWLLKPNKSSETNLMKNRMNQDNSETPYIIATTQNVYIPANYPIINSIQKENDPKD